MIELPPVLQAQIDKVECEEQDSKTLQNEVDDLRTRIDLLLETQGVRKDIKEEEVYGKWFARNPNNIIGTIRSISEIPIAVNGRTAYKIIIGDFIREDISRLVTLDDPPLGKVMGTEIRLDTVPARSKGKRSFLLAEFIEGGLRNGKGDPVDFDDIDAIKASLDCADEFFSRLVAKV